MGTLAMFLMILVSAQFAVSAEMGDQYSIALIRWSARNMQVGYILRTDEEIELARVDQMEAELAQSDAEPVQADQVVYAETQDVYDEPARASTMERLVQAE